MTIKVIGAEFLEYYKDSGYWGDDWWEDAVIKVNEVEEGRPEKCLPTDTVSITGGYVYAGNGNHRNISLETHFKRWKNARVTTKFVIETPKDHAKDLSALIKEYGHRNGIVVKIVS